MSRRSVRYWWHVRRMRTSYRYNIGLLGSIQLWLVEHDLPHQWVNRLGTGNW